MNARPERRLSWTLSVLAVALPAFFATGSARAAGEGEGANLALVARASASYVSGDTSVDALNDGDEPKNSRDRGRGSYGNWPRRGVQWVEYRWPKAICTRKVAVYWWDDRRGVRLPKSCRLLWWDGQKYVPVPNARGLGVKGDTFNETTFDEVRTERLRLEIVSDERFSTGIREWRVYDSGNSPALPPLVEAGVDRAVVVGGRTFLDGVLKTAGGKGGPTVVRWTKQSGPGEVTFGDASAPVTTATFSAPGRYVLALTARRGEVSNADTVAVKVVPAPPKKPLRAVATGRYRIDSPLWSARARALITRWIPHCIEKISDPNLPQGGINNLIEAAAKLAGKPHKGHRGYVFSNAWVLNTIEAMCVALMVDPQGDAEMRKAQQLMRRTLEDWIPRLLAAQEPDGYFQTFFTLGDRPRWSPSLRGAHEGYVAGYFIEAGIAHYRLTGGKDRRLYDAARRLADCWDRHIGPPPKKPWYDGHQAMEMALLHLGRFVNETEGPGRGDRYIRLGKFLLDCRGGGHKYDQSHLPVTHQYEAVGHAVRAAYTYAAMADVAVETADTDYISASVALWDSVVNRKYYVTGGIGSGETSEGFGPDYSLRHNGYCESCSSCGEVFFQHNMHRLYREAKYADLYEETLYNALLGSVDLAGENFFYQNPLTTGRFRYPWHGCPCCVGNIPRVLLMLPTWMYSTGDDGLYVNLFIGSTVTVPDVAGTDVEIVQQTDYPRTGKVVLVINPAAEREFALHIRMPDRSVSEIYSAAPAADGISSLRVNGRNVRPEAERGYVVIRRKWKRGDRVELTLPMKVQVIRAIDRVAATRGQVALRRGPLVYCVESIDQDLEKTFSPTSPLRAQWRGDLLGGVTVLSGSWSDGTPLTAIPYYARSNRAPETAGKGRPQVRSTVWIPVE